MLKKIGSRFITINEKPNLSRSLSTLKVDNLINGIQQHFDDNFKLKDTDYERFLTAVAKAREPSFVRKLSKLQATATPSTLHFGAGFPNPYNFPFKDAVLNLKSGGILVIDEKKLAVAQQYGPTSGYPPLLEQVKKMVLKYHNPPNYENSKVTMTVGAQDGFSRSFEMIMSPGDYILVEDPTFCGFHSVAKPHNVGILGVQIDELGMIPESLQAVLSKWDPNEIRNAAQGVPKILYINPTAANPSGVTLETERKKQIYEIARNYNLLIFEDDPYFFLHYGDATGDFPVSFLSMDVDGRVMRFDSFSKLISAGFRVGYLTGPKKLVAKYEEHSEMSILQASSFSQVIISELLKKWSSEGLENHVNNVRKFYRNQREALNQAVTKHLADICEWNIPTGGMFLWLKVNVLEDTQEMVTKRGLQKELILMPGNSFFVDETKPCPYLRLSYSFITPQEMDEACRRLRELILEEVEICSKQESNTNVFTNS